MPEDFAFKEIMIWGYNLIFKITINNTIQDVYNSIQLGTSKTLLSQDSTALLRVEQTRMRSIRVRLQERSE